MGAIVAPDPSRSQSLANEKTLKRRVRHALRPSARTLVTRPLRRSFVVGARVMVPTFFAGEYPPCGGHLKPRVAPLSYCRRSMFGNLEELQIGHVASGAVIARSTTSWRL